MLKVNESLIVFTEEYDLQTIGLTIYDMLNDSAKTMLPTYQPSPSFSINRVNKPSYTPRASNGRFQSRDTSKTSNDNKAILQYRGWEDIQCPACKQYGHHIDQHGCDQTAINQNISDYRRQHKNDFGKQSVLEQFQKHQQELHKQKISNKKKRNMLRQKLRAAKLELTNDESQYRDLKTFYINAFKKQYKDNDLHDPRENNLHEVREYDILDSEDEDTDSDE